MSDIVADGNLLAFFHDKVGAANGRSGSPLGEDTECYLVHMLSDFANTRELTHAGARRVDDRAFALRLLESLLARPSERIRELKHVADSLLYLLGYFAESLRGRVVDRDYYAGVGVAAYRHLAVATGSGFGSQREPVFAELAARFDRCVDVISDVRDDSLSEDMRLASLVERWAHGDARAERKLVGLGLALPAMTGLRNG